MSNQAPQRQRRSPERYSIDREAGLRNGPEDAEPAKHKSSLEAGAPSTPLQTLFEALAALDLKRVIQPRKGSA